MEKILVKPFDLWSSSMTNQQHPITPPDELLEKWRAAASNVPASLSTDPGGRRDYIDHIATQAARWGADQELEACCEQMHSIPSPLGVPFGKMASNALRAARRPKAPSPKAPSLKEQAKEAWLRFMNPYGHDSAEQEANDYDTIRRALEQLDD